MEKPPVELSTGGFSCGRGRRWRDKCRSAVGRGREKSERGGGGGANRAGGGEKLHHRELLAVDFAVEIEGKYVGHAREIVEDGQ